MIEGQNGIAIENPCIVEVDVRWMVRTSSNGDNNLLRPDRWTVFHFDRIGVDKPRVTGDHFDVVATVKLLPHRFLFRAHRGGCFGQLGDGRVGFDAAVNQQWIVKRFRQTKDGESKCLTGDRAPVSAAAANLFITLNEDDPFPLLGQLHGRSFTTRARANHYHVCFDICHRFNYACRQVNYDFRPCFSGADDFWQFEVANL